MKINEKETGEVWNVGMHVMNIFWYVKNTTAYILGRYCYCCSSMSTY